MPHSSQKKTDFSLLTLSDIQRMREEATHRLKLSDLPPALKTLFSRDGKPDGDILIEDDEGNIRGVIFSPVDYKFFLRRVDEAEDLAWKNDSYQTSDLDREGAMSIEEVKQELFAHEDQENFRPDDADNLAKSAQAESKRAKATEYTDFVDAKTLRQSL